jgi:pimeloyl-ACP methyl ester carboxylesterase
MVSPDTPHGSLFHERIGTGAPVVFVQGVGVAGSGWRPQADGLAKDYACLLFDNRGIGRSPEVSGPLSIQEMARDAFRLMDTVGFAAAHVVGHSMGGVIAQQMALDAPARIKSLSLLCTFSRGSEAARLTPAVLWMGLRTRIGTRAMRRRAFLRMLFSSSYLAGQDQDELASRLVPIIGRDLGEQPPIVMQQLRALGRHDCFDRLSTLAVIPTLVVSAEFDPIARPEYGRRLAAVIPGSRYVQVPDAAHGVTIQKAEVINALLDEHFRSAEPSG